VTVLGRALPVASLLLVLLTAGIAGAEESVLALGLSPEYSILRPDDNESHGVGAGVHAEYGVDEYLNLRFVLGYDHHWLDGPDTLHNLRLCAGATYGLDNTEVVPYLAVGIGVYAAIEGDADDYELDFGGSFGFGFDWVVLDTLALGIEAMYHALFTDIKRVMATFGLRVSYRIDVL